MRANAVASSAWAAVLGVGQALSVVEELYTLSAWQLVWSGYLLVGQDTPGVAFGVSCVLCALLSS